MSNAIATLESQIEALAAIAGPGIAARVAKIDALKARLAALRDAEVRPLPGFHATATAAEIETGRVAAELNSTALRPNPWSPESQSLIDAAGAGRCACRPAAGFVCWTCDESIHESNL